VAAMSSDSAWRSDVGLEESYGCRNLSLLAMHTENQELELQARSWSSGALSQHAAQQCRIDGGVRRLQVNTLPNRAVKSRNGT
jgi:hypothetical protein